MTKHVEIKHRAFVETSFATGFPGGLHRLYVLIDDSGVVRNVMTSEHKQVREVTHVRKAIRVACANMRKRCAEEAEALGEHRVAAAIRKLEL